MGDETTQDLSKMIPTYRVIGILVWALVAGCGVIALYSLQAQSSSRFFAVLGVALAVAGAAAITGALVGFVFGIPRALQATDGGAAAATKNESAGTSANKEKNREQSYRANTSLEQISDWLTKILVGVGLTQLTQLPGALESYSSHIGTAFSGVPGASIFIGAASLYFVVCGFLASYLWTRLVLGKEFSRADVVTREELEQARESNSLALTLAARQLEKGAQAPAEDDLTRAIAEADDLYRAHIYERAKTVRSEGHDKKDAALVERTIPIFRALIKRSPEAFHQNYGQLGLALLDKAPPDLEGCEVNLTRAIALRGEPWEIYGFGGYELVRARCRMQKAATAPDGERQIDPALRDAILSDLRVAAKWPFQRLEPETKEQIAHWVKAHHLLDQVDPEMKLQILHLQKTTHSKS